MKRLVPPPPNTERINAHNIFIEKGFRTSPKISCPRIAFFDKRITRILDLKLLMFLYYVAKRLHGRFYMIDAARALGCQYRSMRKSFDSLIEKGYISIPYRTSRDISFYIINHVKDSEPFSIRVKMGMKLRNQLLKNKRRAIDGTFKKRERKKSKKEKKIAVLGKLYAANYWYVTGPLAGKTRREEFRHLPTPERIKELIAKY